VTATDPRTRVLLTGATGNWGRAALREFRERGDRMHVVAFALDTPHDRAVLDEFSDMENLEIVRGDLLDYAVVQRAVREVDLILHVGSTL